MAKRRIQTIVDRDGDVVVPILEQPPILVRLTERFQRFSPFMWGFLVGVATMSVLIALAAFLLFRSLT